MQDDIIPTKLDEIPQEWKDSLRQSEKAVQIENVNEITDEDFKCFKRSVLLPTPAKGLSEAIGINGKRTLLKRGVFAKNAINLHILGSCQLKNHQIRERQSHQAVMG